MIEALQIGIAITIFLSTITLWPLLREWLALRRVASDADRMYQEAERYRIDKLGEIAESRSADKAKLKTRDAVIVKALAENTKVANLRAAEKKKLLEELNVVNQKISASQHSVDESLAKIELLKKVQDAIRDDSEAIHVLRNRIAELKVSGRNNVVETGKLKVKILDLEESKGQLLARVSSAESDLRQVIAAVEEEADAKAALAQRKERIREHARIRTQRLSEGIPVFEKISNFGELEKYLVKSDTSILSNAEFAKVYPDGRVFQLNETLLIWERFGRVDSEHQPSLELLFSSLRGRENPMTVRCNLSVRPGEVYLPAKHALRHLDD